jgi:6-phosphogluconolactonase
LTRFEYQVEKSSEGVLPVLSSLEETLPSIPLLGFCGGTSIVPVLTSLKQLLQNPTSIFLGADALMIDERLVPESDPDSNISVIRNQLGEDSRKFNLVPFNTMDPVKGAQDYERILAQHGGVFDLIFLGVGEDAHIAGLFPGLFTDKLTSDHSKPKSSFFTFDNSPKPPPKRMTADPSLITSAKNIVLLFFGESKRAAYDRYRVAKETPAECPVLLAKLSHGNVIEDGNSQGRTVYLLRDF